jgi:hypothetical protein
MTQALAKSSCGQSDLGPGPFATDVDGATQTVPDMGQSLSPHGGMIRTPTGIVVSL